MRKKRLIILYLTGLFLMLNMGISFAQRTLVKGTIVDASSNSALPGVNVVEKGTTNGTVTDINGDFAIEVAGTNAVLEFSYVGYLTETIAVGDKSIITVNLVEDITKLDEVVVIGYGTQKKSDLTGSVSIVNTENLDKIVSNDIAKVLQGQTSGVQVFGGGEPGAMQKVQVRGIGTFGNTEPLYVIDGVPIAPATNTNISTTYGVQFENNAPGYGLTSPAGGISDFDPSDIESVQVLKDASAAAIYGARGANGVIIITTKRGKAGTMKVNYEGNYGWQNIPKSTWLDMCNTEQFQRINNTARLNDNTFMARVNNPNRAEFISHDSIDTDWQKETFKQGHITDHSLSIQGGTENATYYGSVGYFDQTGTVVGNGPRYTKYSAQLNLDQKKGRFKFGQSLSYTYSKQLRLTSSRWSNYMTELVQAIPIVQIYDDANPGGYGGSNANYLQIAGNPIAFNNLKEVTFNRNRFLGVVYGEVEILKSLSYRINLSYDRSDWFDKEFIPVYMVGNRHTWEIAELNEWRGENPVMIMENLLNFKKVFGKHDVAAVIGYTAQKDYIEDIYAQGKGYSEPYLKVISAATQSTASANKRFEHTMLSYLGRVNYSYADRYLFTASMRRDYSSNFGPNNKYGDFPSFALGWKVSSEPFFDVPMINLLKIRGGWGKIGNEKIGAFLYETTINNALSYVFVNGGSPNLYPGSSQTYYTDPSIRWEERLTTNIGFDLAMFKNKIELTAEYYYNEARDILMVYPIPISSGAVGWSIPAANGASMINKGIEISLSYRKFEGEFHYQVSGNITTLKNEVTKIGEANLTDKSVEPSILEVGYPMGELYGWVFDGIFQSDDQINIVAPFDASGNPNAGYDATKHAFQHMNTSPGDVMFKDINNDGQITEADRDYLGSAIPKFTYGLNLSAEYKNFDFSAFIQGVYGNKVFNQVYRVANQLGEGNYSVESYENYWMPVDSAVGRQSDVWPRPSVIDYNGNNRISDRWIQDGAYIRLQNLQLGYTLPKSMLNKIKIIDNIRIYVQAQNLWTYTKLYGYDPDFINNGTSLRGYSSGSYPTPRTFLIGIKLGL
jgi:TonB-linked SusC/RagA family outer membrane protein